MIQNVEYVIDAEHPKYALVLKVDIKRNKLVNFFNGMASKFPQMRGYSFDDFSKKEIKIPPKGYAPLNKQFEKTIKKIEKEIKEEYKLKTFKFISSQVTNAEIVKEGKKHVAVVTVTGLYDG